MDGILISGADARSAGARPELQRHAAGCRRLPHPHRRASRRPARRRSSKRPDAALREKIEDKLWAIQDENTEAVTRAMEAGGALTRIFENGGGERRDLDRGPVRHQLCRDRRHQSGAVPHQIPRLGRSRAAAVPGSLPRQGHAHGVLRHDRPQRLSAGAQQDLFASAAAGRRRLEHRQQPQPPHLQRSGGACRRPQPPLLSDPELCPRHGQRQHRDDARDRRAGPRARAGTGAASAPPTGCESRTNPEPMP